MFGIKSRRRLALENAAMRRALLWYATEETWRRHGIHPKGAARKQWQKSAAASDRGSLAMRTLSKVDEPSFLIFSIKVPMPLETAPAIPRDAIHGTDITFPRTELLGAAGNAASTDTE